MEIQIKKAIKAGNSSAVILPRSWLNKDVRIELVKKTPQMILSDVIDIIKEEIELKEIIGIYLTGSYARGEEDAGSDIDVLIITKTINKTLQEGNYNVLLISSELLEYKLNNDLFPIGSMIKEAEPILNLNYLDSINIKVTENNVKWYIETTENQLELIRKVIDKMKETHKKYISDRVAYTLILRIRTLYIIKDLIENKSYSKKEFIKLIKNISHSENSYERYLAVKNNLKEKNKSELGEIIVLYEYLEKELKEIKKLMKNK